MKILMIFQAAPLPPPLDMGSAKRNFPFLRENLKRHEVSIISYGSAEDEKIFRDQYGDACKEIYFVRHRRKIVNILRRVYLMLTGRSTFRLFYLGEVQRVVNEFCRRNNYDIIHCCTAILGFYKFPKGTALVGDTHNVEYDLFYRMYQESRGPLFRLYCYLVYKLGKKDEINVLKKFDAVLTTTGRDRDMFRRDLPDKSITVIQNGVDQSFFEIIGEPVEPRSMLFMGLMNWYPNKHAVTYFLDEILPLVRKQVPDAKLTILGAHPSPELIARGNDHVTVTGFIRDVRPYIAKSEVFIIPLLIGSGIRGKALEAMAMKKPIVSTTLGCAGIRLTHGESALFADTPQEFAAAIVRCFNDPALRTRLGNNAYENAQQYYQWEAKGAELNAIYESVVQCRRPANAGQVPVPATSRNS